MPAGWSALTCEGCGGTLKAIGPPFSYMLVSDDYLTCEAAQRLADRLGELAENPPAHRAIILDKGMTVKELKHPLGGVLRCENCGMLYERQVDVE